jgi:hypothetical protein
MLGGKTRERPDFRRARSLSEPKVSLNLHFDPEVGRSSKRHRKAQRHGGGDARVAVENPRKMSPGDPQTSCGFANRHLAEIIAQNLSGMCWVENHAPPLMIVQVVHQNRVLSVEGKGHSPVATHHHGAMAFQVSFKRMQPTSRSVHIFGSTGHVERSEQPPQSLSMFWLDPGL